MVISFVNERFSKFYFLGITLNDEQKQCAFAGDHIILTLVGIDMNNVSVGECHFIVLFAFNHSYQALCGIIVVEFAETELLWRNFYYSLDFYAYF